MVFSGSKGMEEENPPSLSSSSSFFNIYIISFSLSFYIIFFLSIFIFSALLLEQGRANIIFNDLWFVWNLVMRLSHTWSFV